MGSALDDFTQAQIEALSCGNWLFNCECGRCADRRELQLEHDARQIAMQRISDLEAQCARVQRDADRYAWLRDDPTGRRMQGCVEAAFTAFCAGASQTGPECLDVAIDAAMAAKEAG